MMTVKELMNILANYPEDYPVEIRATYDRGYGVTGGDVQFAELYETEKEKYGTRWNEEG